MIDTRLGISWVANATSSPPFTNTGASLSVPSVVSRTTSPPRAEAAMESAARAPTIRTQASRFRRRRSEQFMDDASFRQHPKLRSGGGIDAGQFQDRRSHHRRRDRVGNRMLAPRIALAD